MTFTTLNPSLGEAEDRVPYPVGCPWKRHVQPLLGVSVGDEPTKGCSTELS